MIGEKQQLNYTFNVEHSQWTWKMKIHWFISSEWLMGIRQKYENLVSTKMAVQCQIVVNLQQSLPLSWCGEN